MVNGSRVCSVCVPGMFVHKSTDSCHTCPEGKYTDDIEQALFCALYKFKTEGINSSACTACPAGWQGTFSHAIKSMTCALCEAGMYQKKIGQTLCYRCREIPAMMRGSSSSRTECQVLGIRQETYHGRKRCADNNMILMDVRPGSTEILIEDNRTCVPCPPGAVCSSGRSEEEVEDGRVGKINVPGLWEGTLKTLRRTSIRHIIANKGYWVCQQQLANSMR